jgi:hypothetical protein
MKILPPTVTVRQRRRPGRPPVDDRDESVQVCVTLPAKKYDELDERARSEGASVPAIIRRDLGIKSE